ncbi:hypothetical protein ABH931_005490 [Streptacidiphilus sp. MAP12-33]|uniref:DUF6247 family protein n=1 Tax=Streptacidiphilus sp. MAP12-33 TaxID=3156266 RepID=UPI003518AAF2
MTDTIFQASDLATKRVELLTAARSGLARVRDKDGTSLVMLPESRLHLLETLADWSQAAVRLEAIISRGAGRDVSALGDLAWLRVFDDEDLREFLAELQAALTAAHADGHVSVLEDCLQAWRTTARQLEDPLRRSILLGQHDPADFVTAPRPEDE